MDVKFVMSITARERARQYLAGVGNSPSDQGLFQIYIFFPFPLWKKKKHTHLQVTNVREREEELRWRTGLLLTRLFSRITPISNPHSLCVSQGKKKSIRQNNTTLVVVAVSVITGPCFDLVLFRFLLTWLEGVANIMRLALKKTEGFRPDRRDIFLHEINIHDFLLLSANVVSK